MGTTVTAFALGAGLLTAAPAAWGDTGTPDPAAVESAHLASGPTWPASGTSPTLTAQQQASAQAKATGQAVPVAALTDPYSTTVANPDGTTFTQTQSAEPQRVQKDGVWTDLDATLVSAAGGLSPKVSSEPLTLSAGGSGPLATMSTTDGKQLALTAPFALPTPTVTGDTALYPDVAAGIDLSVQATPTGGFSTVFIVKNADAAANPLLTHLTFTTAGTGVSVTAAADGSLTAADSNGSPVFSAPTPQVWDSSTTTSSGSTATATPTAAAGAAPAAQGARLNALSTTTSATPSATSTSTDAAAAGTDASSTDGPGAGAKVAQIAAAASGDTLTLTPPAGSLVGSGVTYPVFVDPAWHSDNLDAQGATWTQSAYTDTNNLANGNDDSTSTASYPGVGVCGDYGNGTGCSPNDTERSYYQFSVTPYNNATIHQVIFGVSEKYSADASCSNTYPVVAAGIWGTIDNKTSWNNPPGGDTAQFSLTKYVGGAARSGCADPVPVQFDITSGLKALFASQATIDHLVMRLHGDESNINAFKRFTHAASLTISYDLTPPAPSNLHSSNIAAGYYKDPNWVPFEYCTAGAVGVDSNWPWVNSTGTTLDATVPSGRQTQYQTNYRLWDDSSTKAGDTYDHTSGWANSGTTVGSDPLTLGGYLQDGHAYGWLTTASDGLAPDSANSSICHFRVDATAPTITITNTGDFPPSDSGITPTKYVGQYGTIGISVTDPAPKGYTGDALAAQTSGVQCLDYSADPAMANARTVCGSAIGTLQIIAPHWGTNILYLQADDYAQNFSQIYAYAYYAPWNANGPAPKFGDVTGDTIPDALAVGKDGNLYAHSLPTSSSTTPTTSLVSLANQSPHNDGWNGYQLTHRGSVTGGTNVDTLIVHKPADATLYYYKNPGNEHIDGLLDDNDPLPRPICTNDPNNTNDHHCADYTNDWSKTQQIVALGDVGNATLSQTSGTFANRTGLITVESPSAGKTELWYFPMYSASTFGQPILLDTTTNWANFDLLSPGDWAHQNDSTGKPLNQPGLWARNRTTGALTGYTLTVATIAETDSYGYPAVDTSGNPILLPQVTAISEPASLGNTTFPLATYPVISSDGDLTDSTGTPDIWTADTTGTLAEWTPTTTAGTNNAPTAYTWNTAPTNVLGATTGASNRWLQPANNFAGAVMTTDGDNTSPATPTGTPTYGTNTDSANLTKRGATFNGTNYLSASNTSPGAKTPAAVDTGTDYTLSAWVKLDPSYNPTTGTYTALCQRDATGKRCGAYLQYSHYTSSWTFVAPSSDVYPAPGGNAQAADSHAATLNKWTHLVGEYNATTQTMTLYVNGTAAGVAHNASPWTANGPLLIGGQDNANNSSTGSFLGSVADVQTFPTLLTQQQITTLYTTGLTDS
ncbi:MULTISPECIES: LamG domain-containing protein [Streptacidiphilus]|uniref:LamG domain-containing protein n=1 Tax=Streptacidiphilus cavernicola TaxID=3342716 RepID=A0ABV6UHL2_9ACTN|nr:LamG domain-containing protein [Streptacidiphilus jeojiense]